MRKKRNVIRYVTGGRGTLHRLEIALLEQRNVIRYVTDYCGTVRRLEQALLEQRKDQEALAGVREELLALQAKASAAQYQVRDPYKYI